MNEMAIGVLIGAVVTNICWFSFFITSRFYRP